MKSIIKHIIIFSSLLCFPEAKSAETLYLYKGTFSRTIKIEELHEFKKTKIPSSKLKNLINITNQNRKDLYKILSYEIDLPLKTSSKLMNSRIGKVFLSRLSKIIYPNKILDNKIGTKAIRSGLLISSYNNYDFIKKGHLGDIVLIPKNDIPFSMKNLYNRYTPNDLFTEEFKNTFGLVYSKISSTEFFDIYNYKYQKTIKNLN